jgi:hypothetical protein
MDHLYHTNLEIPFLSFVNAIILLMGFYYTGNSLLRITGLKTLISKYSLSNYQNILFCTYIILFFFYPLTLYFKISISILKYLTFVIFLFGIFNLIKLLSNFFFTKKKIAYFNLKKKINSFELTDYILILFIFGYFLISSSPVTNADSLDYHFYTAKYLKNLNEFPTLLTNFHSSRLSGSGEIFILMGLFVGSEQFGSILQTTGFITLYGVFKKYKLDKFYFLLILCSPILIFFTTSIKPQLFYICSSGFVLAVICNELKNINNNNNYEFMKLVVILSAILYLNITAKFSFLLGSFLLSLLIIFLSVKKKILFKTILIQISVYLIILLPVYFWKFTNFGGSFVDLLINPFDTQLHGLKYFKYYLTNLNKGNFIWIFFPQNFKEITQTIGLGSLVIYTIFTNWKNENIIIVFLLLSFCFITYLFGQTTARFFYEPYIWLIIYLSIFYKLFKISKIFKLIVYFQSIITSIILIYGISILTPGIISKEIRNNVLSDHANGYLVFKWLKNELKKINYDGPIISSKRSIGFLDNISIPPEHLYYVDYNSPESIIYIDEIKKLKPKYIMVSDDTNIFSVYKNCFGKKIAHGYKVDKLAVRNPFLLSSQYFDVRLYEFNYDKLKDCMSIDKNYYLR